MHSFVEGSGSDGLEKPIGELGLLIHQLVCVKNDPSHSGSASLKSVIRSCSWKVLARFASGSIGQVLVAEVLHEDEQVSVGVTHGLCSISGSEVKARAGGSNCAHRTNLQSLLIESLCYHHGSEYEVKICGCGGGRPVDACLNARVEITGVQIDANGCAGRVGGSQKPPVEILPRLVDGNVGLRISRDLAQVLVDMVENAVVSMAMSCDKGKQLQDDCQNDCLFHATV